MERNLEIWKSWGFLRMGEHQLQVSAAPVRKVLGLECPRCVCLLRGAVFLVSLNGTYLLLTTTTLDHKECHAMGGVI